MTARALLNLVIPNDNEPEAIQAFVAARDAHRKTSWKARDMADPPARSGYQHLRPRGTTSAGGMSISSGWQEQYARMHRSYERLLAISRGEHPDARSSDTARDGLYHFFTDAYHLKDWIKAADRSAGEQIDDRIRDSLVMSVCADLANGIKHFLLDPKRKHWTRDHRTAFTGQDVSVRPAAAGTGKPPEPALHAWRYTSRGTTGDAVTLANEVVRQWDAILRDQSLLP